MNYTTINYNGNIADQINSLKAIFHREGYLYLENSDTELVNNLVSEIGHGVMRDANRRRKTEKGINGGMSVDSYYPSVELHSESSFSPSQPEIVGFYCSKNNRSDGNTLVCDGRDIWKHLDLKLKKELLTAKIEYKLAIDIKLNKQKMKGKREWYIDKPGIKDCIIDYDDQKIRMSYETSPIYMDPFTQEISVANHLLIELYTEPQIMERRIAGLDEQKTEEWRNKIKTVAHGVTKQVIWQEGDLLILKNRIIMHGRSFCANQDGRIISVIQRKGFN